jgi:multisubunit Na+/H+ antiporter MnhE subunit
MSKHHRLTLLLLFQIAAAQVDVLLSVVQPKHLSQVEQKVVKVLMGFDVLALWLRTEFLLN